MRIIPRFPRFPPCSPLAAAGVGAGADAAVAAAGDAGDAAAAVAAGQLGASPGAPPLPSACVDLSCNLYLDFVFGFCIWILYLDLKEVSKQRFKMFKSHLGSSFVVHVDRDGFELAAVGLNKK